MTEEQENKEEIQENFKNKGKTQENTKENNNISKKDEQNNNLKMNINIVNSKSLNNKNTKENDKKSKEKNKKLILVFNKKLKEMEKLSNKFDILFNKHMNKIKLCQTRKNENKENENSQDKKLIEKELTIKNDLKMIHNLTKENKKLKEQIDSQNKLLFSSQEFSPLEKLSLKNDEIEQLKKKVFELNKKYDEVNTSKINCEKKIKQLESIINKQKRKIFELYSMKENKSINSIDNRNTLKVKTKQDTNFLILKSASDNNIIKKDKKIKSIPLHNYFNNNFYQLLNEKETNALKKLFDSNEDFNTFNEKLTKLETRNKIVEGIFEKDIKNLNKIVSNKQKEIEILNKEIGQKDLKIKSLENNINELKLKNKILENKQKKLLIIEKQLIECGYYTNKMSDDDKLEKLNDLVIQYKKKLNKDYINKCKDEEIDKINNELGDIKFISSKFFENLKKNKNKNIEPASKSLEKQEYN